ncbi:hypothetical protein X907_2000 [Glycocaulis alkaliphilus]|uniref:Uncharacterized protein n=1 Tax=Glycocaulis alkaliphilus TaxID=1434191 RepID=A0A3T0EAQ2_9PROT|nr:hypothetical protein X907_2000 [Glycocaulis alkaliphilus]
MRFPADHLWQGAAELREETPEMGKAILMWFLGIPIPVIILILILF